MWIVLKYLLNLKKCYAFTILTYGLSKCNRFFFLCYHFQENILCIYKFCAIKYNIFKTLYCFQSSGKEFIKICCPFILYQYILIYNYIQLLNFVNISFILDVYFTVSYAFCINNMS